MKTWNQLRSLAEAEVRATLADLPADLRTPAAALPVSYERAPGAAAQADGYDPDLLGLFVGPPRAEPDSSPLPPQIILYLENLWEFAGYDESIYRDEVRTTFLHELGHYLGLGEGDLEDRGLD